MSEISLVASEINTSLIKKTESLSRGASLSPMRSVSRNAQPETTEAALRNGPSKQSRLVYPKFYASPNKTSVHLNKIELMLGDDGKEVEPKLQADSGSSKCTSQIPLFIRESSSCLGNVSVVHRMSLNCLI